jgi:hypothetical protein
MEESTHFSGFSRSHWGLPFRAGSVVFQWDEQGHTELVYSLCFIEFLLQTALT